ncbi:MAG: VacJ family lipoprotein [Rhodospirillales bacterium]
MKHHMVWRFAYRRDTTPRSRAAGRFFGLSRFAILLLAGLTMAGCAAMPDAKDPEAVADFEQTNDPIEPFNRGIFEVNQALDKGIIKPIALVYRDYTPAAVQTVVRNMLNNLRSPVIFANDVLQGKLRRAWETLVRFLINSTMGFGGLGNPAQDMVGFKFHNEDFGQTLAVWGMPEGPYIVLPILGPSNPRDTVGLVVDALIDPLNIWLSNTDRSELIFARSAVRGIDERSRNIDVLDELEKSSLDFYASLRSLYRQHRGDEINDGQPTGNYPMPGLSGVSPDMGPGLDGPGLDAASRAP